MPAVAERETEDHGTSHKKEVMWELGQPDTAMKEERFSWKKLYVNRHEGGVYEKMGSIQHN